MDESRFPLHLLLPLVASLLFVIGLMLIKRASGHGVRPWTVTFLANLWAAVVFSSVWLMEGGPVARPMLVDATLVAVLYILGQVFTFLALSHGDVSVATPVFSIKVLLVAVMLTWIANDQLPRPVWLAAACATLGIALVQRTGRPAAHRRTIYSVTLALCAATTFSLFDVLVQSRAPIWSVARFLPVSFAIAAVLSLGFLPWVNRPSQIPSRAWLPLLAGTLCIALQALCIVFAIAHFGDAARVNIVYALRGLWGVVLAFAFARILQSGEAAVPRQVFFARLAGAILLTVAVLLAILARS